MLGLDKQTGRSEISAQKASSRCGSAQPSLCLLSLFFSRSFFSFPVLLFLFLSPHTGSRALALRLSLASGSHGSAPFLPFSLLKLARVPAPLTDKRGLLVSLSVIHCAWVSIGRGIGMCMRVPGPCVSGCRVWVRGAYREFDGMPERACHVANATLWLSLCPRVAVWRARVKAGLWAEVACACTGKALQLGLASSAPRQRPE